MPDAGWKLEGLPNQPDGGSRERGLETKEVEKGKVRSVNEEQ